MRNFITSHGLVIIRILLGPDSTVSQIASSVGIQEQPAHAIVRDLVKEGFITSKRVGRRNSYRVNWDKAIYYEALPGLGLLDIVNSLAALGGTMTAPKPKVMLFVAEHPDAAPGDIALGAGIATKDVRSILRELEEAGMISGQKKSQRTTYRVSPSVLPESDRPPEFKDLVRLAIHDSVRPPLPDPMEVLMRIFGPTG